MDICRFLSKTQLLGMFPQHVALEYSKEKLSSTFHCVSELLEKRGEFLHQVFNSFKRSSTLTLNTCQTNYRLGCLLFQFTAMARDKLDTQAPLKIAFIHPDLGIGKKLDLRNFTFFKVNTISDPFSEFRWG